MPLCQCSGIFIYRRKRLSKVYIFESRGVTYVGAKVPSIIGPEISKSWACSDNKSVDEKVTIAASWQLSKGCDIWGATRFLKYLGGEITSQQLRGNLHSVSVSPAYTQSRDKTIKYKYIRVEWRDKDKKSLCRSFSKRKYGNLVDAEHEATIFAAHKRAELTGGELHLPPFEFDLSHNYDQTTP